MFKQKKIYIGLIALLVVGLVAGGYLSLKSTQADFLNDSRFIVSAHRGATTSAPENTIPAIKDAAKLGYLAIEIDPQVNKDGDVFLMHDPTLNRTTNHTGLVKQTTTNQMQKAIIKVAEHDKYKDETLFIPSFEDAVREIAKTDMVINIDGSKIDLSNEKAATKVVDVLKKHKVYHRSFFVITNKEQREAFLNKYEDACVSWLYRAEQSLEDEIKLIKKYKSAMLSLDLKYATKENLKLLNDNKVFYQVYKVDDYSEAKRLKAAKVPMIETNVLLPNNIE